MMESMTTESVRIRRAAVTFMRLPPTSAATSMEGAWRVVKGVSASCISFVHWR